MALNSLADVIELARMATPETIGRVQAELSPAIVELGLTEAETTQVFAVLKEMTGVTLTALRKDFGTYLKVNNLTADHESAGTVLVKLALDSGMGLWHDPEGDLPSPSGSTATPSRSSGKPQVWASWNF